MKLIDLPEFVNKNQLDKLKNAGSSSKFRLQIKNAENESDPVELLIYEEIGENMWTGEGVTASGVRDFLNGNKDRDVVVRINSPGGLVFDGIVIYNALSQHPGNVTTVIEGIAASAATIISVAGDTRLIHENAMFMVHRAWGLVVGNEAEMTDMAETLRKLDQQLAATLAVKSNLSTEEVHALMVGEIDGVHLTAAETLEKGFVDEIIPLAQDDDDDASEDDDDDPEEPEEDDEEEETSLTDRMRQSYDTEVQERLSNLAKSKVDERLNELSRNQQVAARLAELDDETS